MYEAWSDASVRGNIGYIAYIVFEGDTIKDQFTARVNIDCNYALEKLALCLLVKKVNELGIDQDEITIFTDCKGIPPHLSKKTSKVYKQFNLLIKEKIIRKYRKVIRFKHGGRNKAHNLSRLNSINWFDYNTAIKFK